jgi:hypothetical protein
MVGGWVQVALVACAVVLVLYGWVFDNWKWADHQIIYEVGLWAAFVTLIEALTLSRLYLAQVSLVGKGEEACYVGSYGKNELYPLCSFPAPLHCRCSRAVCVVRCEFYVFLQSSKCLWRIGSVSALSRA